jgi:hypothetical protein
MSALIARQPKDTREQTAGSLSGSVLADLGSVASSSTAPRSSRQRSLEGHFRRDEAFLEWKVRGQGQELQKAPKSSGRRLASPGCQ